MPSYPVRPKNLKKAGLNEDNVAALRNLTKRVDFLYEGTINNGAGSIVWNPTTGTYQVTRSDGTVYNLIMEEVNDPLDSSGNPNDYSYFPRADSGAVLKNSVLQEKEKSLAMNMVPSSDGTKPSFRISGDSGAGLDLYQNTSRTLAARFSTDLATATTTLRSQQKFRFDIGTSEAMRIDTNLTVTIGTLVVSTDFQTPFADFDVTASVTRETARLWWNNDDNAKTLMIGGEGNQVDIKVGESTYFRVKASSAITKGQVVMITGTVGASGALTAAPATGLTKTESSKIMGIAAEDIALNGWGYIAEFGLLRQIDTSAFSDGDILYYDPSVTGGLTATEPGAPNPKVEIAAVVLGGTSNGSVFLRLNHHFELNELNDINTTGVSNGDLLKYNSTSDIWEDTPQSSVAAGTANTLATARTISLTGDVSGSTSFDGSADVSITATVADDSHNHIIANVDGLQAALDAKQDSSTALTTTTNFGGDVSGTYNAIVVADDSHNHIIANVDGLQAALDAKVDLAGDTMTGSLVIDSQTSALQLGAGDNTTTFSGDQINFGDSTNPIKYRHAIGTRHNATGDSDNAIDFYLWDYGTDNSLDVGTYRVLTLDQTGSEVLSNLSITGTLDTTSDVTIAASTATANINMTNTANRAEINLQESGSTKGILQYRGSTNGTLPSTMRIGTQDADDLIFNTAGAERLRVLGTGNVGIGTTSPAQKLHVANAGTTYVRAENTTTGVLSDFGTNATGTTILNRSANPILFYTNTTERARIDGSGNVGISTSSPSYPLDVNGQIATQDAYLITANSSGTPSAGAFISRPASNTIALGTASAERLRIDSSGQVGIGISSPNRKLSVNSGTTDVVAQFESSDSGAFVALKDNASSSATAVMVGAVGDDMRFDVADVEAMRLTSVGLGVGTSSPVTLTSGIKAISIRDTGGKTTGDKIGELNFVTNDGSFTGTFSDGIGAAISAESTSAVGGAYALTFTTATTSGSNRAERMRITHSGEVYIAGTTDQGGYNLQVNGTGVWAAGAYVNGSDKRLKNNIKPISNSLEIVKNLNPVTFKYNESYSADQSVQTGFIAQELQSVLADEIYIDGVVRQDKEHLNVSYQSLIPILVKAIQELEKEVAELKGK